MAAVGVKAKTLSLIAHRRCRAIAGALYEPGATLPSRCTVNDRGKKLSFFVVEEKFGAVSSESAFKSDYDRGS